MGKPYLNIISTNGSGEEEADKYLTKIGYLFGGIKTGMIFKSNNDTFDIKKFNKLVLKINDIIKHKIKLKPSLMNALYFSSMKSIIKKNKSYFEFENKVWEERKWFNKSYSTIFKERQVK